MSARARKVLAALGVVGAAVITLLACSSFDASPDAPAGADGALPDEGGRGPGPDADAAHDSASVCVPQPIEPSDAGEDANCDGTTVILAESSKHCGRCGHDCLGASCVDGRCSIVPLTTSELGSTNVTASTATHVYYSTYGASDRYVRRLSLDDAGKVDTLTMPTGIGYLRDTRVVGTAPAVYVVLSDRGIISVPVDGGAESTVVDDGNNNVAGLAVDATNLYWLRGSLFARAHADGANASANFVIHGQTATSAPTTMIADGSNLYWAVREKRPDGGNTTSIRVRGPGKLDTASVRLSSVEDVVDFAVDAEFLYWSTPKGEVWRAEKATNAMPELVTRVTGSALYSKGLAVDEGFVYAAMTASALLGDLQMTLVQAPKCGGPPRTLAVDVTNGGLAAAGGHLYWGIGNSVRRVAK